MVIDCAASWLLREETGSLGVRPALGLALDAAFLLAAIMLLFFFGISLSTLTGLIFVAGLFLTALTDLSKNIVPNTITLSLAIAAFAHSLLPGGISLWMALIGGLTGLVFFSVVAVAGSIVAHRRVLGGGDIKLAFSIGLLLGWEGLLVNIILASLLALIYGSVLTLNREIPGNREIPFGPFLLLPAVPLHLLVSDGAFLDICFSGLGM
ncbi:MAG: A24 family peptidase [Candidatus Zixiibacteriota bacterium]